MTHDDQTFIPRPKVWNATSLANVQAVKWLAKGRLPRASVTILVGDEGIGKSLLWVWIVAAITTGRALPEFGIPARPAGHVLLVLTEDDWSSTVRPRLELAGADLANIAVICEEKDGSGTPVFPRDMYLVRDVGALDLIVLDAFLDTVEAGLSMRDPQQARQALHPWRETALATGASVLLVTHTNRMDSKNPRDRYGISGELRKKARMTLYAQRNDENCLVVGPEKSNIAGRTPASMFTIDPVQVFPPTDDTDGTVPRLCYVGDSEKTAREIVAELSDSQHADEDREDRTEAEAWLEDYLTQQGTTASAEVKKAARKVGISERTVKRASSSIGVISESVGFPRVTYWSMPSDSGATGTPHHSESGPTGPTGRDLHKQNGPTGADSQSGHAHTHGGPTGPTGVVVDLDAHRETHEVPSSTPTPAASPEWQDPQWGTIRLVAGKPFVMDSTQFSAWRIAGQPDIHVPAEYQATGS